jgi:hypothetical protein
MLTELETLWNQAEAPVIGALQLNSSLTGATTEVWSRTNWSYFDTYQSLTSANSLGRVPNVPEYPFSLATQQHIDLRNFAEAAWIGSGISTGFLGSFNNWPGIQIALAVGTNTYSSQYTAPIDLTQIGSGTLSVAAPNFPLGSITLNQSYLELSSDSFSETVCSLPFSTSTTTPISGNSTLTWPYSALTGVDLTAIDGVRFVVKATNTGTLTMMALRLLGPNWVQTNVDFDNISNVLRQSIPVNGAVASAGVPNNQVIPMLLRSALIPGNDDPRPVDGALSVLFNTGAAQQIDTFTIYMREQTTAFITQIDLEGDTQASLTGQPQPTSGISEYTTRTMGDLNQFDMAQLDGETMLNLEETADPVYTSWQGATITWGVGTSVQVTNSANPTGGYIYQGPTAPNLSANTSYLAILTLIDTTAQLQIFNVNQTTYAIESNLFDTTVIPDVSLFARLAGRTGFQAILQDGNAFIKEIRPRGLVFAEYRSAPLTSITPVKGARLYVSSSPNLEYWDSWSPHADTAEIVPVLAVDTARTTTGSSTSVTVITPSLVNPGQGVISNQLSPDAISGITDFDNFGISFDLWFPSAALNAHTNLDPILTCALLSSYGALVPLTLPVIQPDHWQHMILQPSLVSPYPESGIYQLVIYYNGTVGTEFWIDNVQVFERTIAWSARSVVDDPWDSNYAPWTPFRDFLNSDSNGVRFYPQGDQLQLRGQGLHQNSAVMSSPKLVPIYAELGRLVWPETLFVTSGNQITSVMPTGLPTAAITSTQVGSTYTFNFSGAGSSGAGATSLSPGSTVGNWEWSFSDGTYATGIAVQHTFPSTEPLPLVATLLVRDNYGQTASTQWFEE